MGKMLVILSSLPAAYTVNDIWLHLATALILTVLGTYTWVYRQRRGGAMVVCALAIAVIELLSAVIIATSPGLPAKFLWFRIHHVAAVPLSTIWLVLTIQLSGRERWLTRPVIALLVVMLVFSWLILLTNDWHGLYWHDLTWDGDSLRFIRGPVFWFGLFYNYIHILLALILNINWVMHSSGLRRWQAVSMLMAPLFAIAGNILWNLDRPFLFGAPLPVGFLLMGLTAVWGYSRFKLFSLVTQAQAAAATSSSDGMIIIDDQDYIVELNPVAYKLCGKHFPYGKYQEVFSFWPRLVETVASPVASPVESELTDGSSHNFYLLHVYVLLCSVSGLLGKVVIIRDISEQKRAQDQIIEQQKALSILAERNRLGRELHDGPGQIWSYVNMQVEAACLLLAENQPAKAETLLQRLAEVARDVHVDIRESIAGLKTRVSVENGLWQPLEEYIQWFRQNSGIDAELLIDKAFTAGLLPPTAEAQLLRIIQEALTNIRKHAGARHVQVLVRQRGEKAEFRVVDDGQGFDLAAAEARKGCYGLRIMKERATEAGAQFRIESQPRTGTAIIILLPLDRNKEDKP